VFDPTLVVPVGNVVSAFFVLVAVFVANAGWRLRLLALFLALGAALLTSNLAGVAPTEPRLAFLFGFVPPLGTALLVIHWRKLRRDRQVVPPSATSGQGPR
jgi:hypothetical protein